MAGERELGLLNAGVAAVQKCLRPSDLSDPEVVLYATWISVWGRWFFWLVGVFLAVYRPGFWFPQDLEYLVNHIVVPMANGLVHYRLLTKRSVTWRWLLFLSAVDVATVTFAVVIAGGFSTVFYLGYYPALAVIAVVFSSLRLSLAWTTATAIVYVIVCLIVGDGLDLNTGDEKVLATRLAVLYAMMVGISIITRFERSRWRTSVARERQLRRERIEISQTIHDTTAQTAYMIGLGIHRARELAGESNRELAAALDAAMELSRSAMWEMRGPIDAGHIVEGRELGRVLWSHCVTFEKITGVPAEMLQTGAEPALATYTRTRLFSIAHNALTNAFLHARAGRVEVRLDFQAEQVMLSVSDDGVGLPDDYAERGRGFSGMRAEAEMLGGTLAVESAGDGSGTTITCVVPDKAERGGA